MAPTRTRTPKPAIRFTTDTSAPRLAQAVGLATAVLAKTKCRTWDELAAAQEAGDEEVIKLISTMTFDAEQIEVIAEQEAWLTLIQVKRSGDTEESVGMAICPMCERFLLVAGSSTVPAKCGITADCEGSPKKAARAAQVKKAVAGVVELVADGDEPADF